jgi:hypothetical protein
MSPKPLSGAAKRKRKHLQEKNTLKSNKKINSFYASNQHNNGTYKIDVQMTSKLMRIER